MKMSQLISNYACKRIPIHKYSQCHFDINLNSMTLIRIRAIVMILCYDYWNETNYGILFSREIKQLFIKID